MGVENYNNLRQSMEQLKEAKIKAELARNENWTKLRGYHRNLSKNIKKIYRILRTDEDYITGNFSSGIIVDAPPDPNHNMPDNIRTLLNIYELTRMQVIIENHITFQKMSLLFHKSNISAFKINIFSINNFLGQPNTRVEFIRTDPMIEYDSIKELSEKFPLHGGNPESFADQQNHLIFASDILNWVVFRADQQIKLAKPKSIPKI